MGKYSVLISVYEKEKTGYFIQSVESVLNQTIPPEEIVIVCDGPLTNELDMSIHKFCQKSPSLFTVLRLEENQGLGIALAKGIEAARNDLIGRMDADDIALPERFEKQLGYFSKHPQMVLLGGQIEEFEGDPENILGKREVPCEEGEIRLFAKKRNPFNHMTVMYKKSIVIQSGNYRSMIGFEDYDLWIRILLSGAEVANLPDILVKCRAGEALIERRGGKIYANQCKKFIQSAYKLGFYTKLEYLKNYMIRVGVARMPTKLRQFLYTHILRKGKD